jgi:hypothetical protein
LNDRIEAVATLHKDDSSELHFRFIGKVKNRQFVVNVQFEASDAENGDRLRPEELDFMIVKVLNLVFAHVRSRPNPALH